MADIYFYLTLSGILTLLLWTPYILARVFVWGLPTFLNNYPDKFPIEKPQQPLWAERAQRAHLNMVETMPAFIASVIGAAYFAAGNEATIASIASWSAIFFWARVGYSAVYIMGIPFVRTPVYLVSWLSILAIGSTVIL